MGNERPDPLDYEVPPHQRPPEPLPAGPRFDPLGTACMLAGPCMVWLVFRYLPDAVGEFACVFLFLAAAVGMVLFIVGLQMMYRAPRRP